MNEVVGKRIKDRRKELHLTLEDLAIKCEVAKSTIFSWEKGYVDNLKTTKISLLSQALKVDPLYFIDIPDANPYSNLTEMDKEIIDAFVNLSLKQKIEVGHVVFELQKENERSK